MTCPLPASLYDLAPMSDVARALAIFFGGPFLFVTSAMIGTLVFYWRNTADPREWLIVALGAAAMRCWLDVHGGALA